MPRLFSLSMMRAFRRMPRSPHPGRVGLAVAAVLTCLACLLAVPARGHCAEAPAAPGVTGIVVRQAGVFAAVPPQEAAASGVRYRLLREGDSVAPEAGTAFGVVFEVQGQPAGAPVVVEAELLPPGNDSVAQKWFVPAVAGKSAQAVASYVYDWEAVAGPWRLTLAEGGRILAEQTFEVGGPQRTSAGHAVARSDLPAPASTSTPAPTPAPTPVPAPEPLPVASAPPAVSVPATPAVPEQPVTPFTPDQPATSGQPDAAAPAKTPDAVATPPQAPAPALVPDTPGATPGAKDTAAQAEPSRAPEKAAEKASENTPGKAPDRAPDKTPAPVPDKDKGKKTPSPEQAGKAPASAPAKEAVSAKGTLYLLQTGLFTVKDNAFSQAARYRAKGYPGCVLEEGAGSKRRYRVIVGRFPEHGRAVEARRAFVAREGVEAMVKEFPAAEVSPRLQCR